MNPDHALLKVVVDELSSGCIDLSRIREVEEKMPFGLSYSSIYHSLDANSICSFSGKTVLEIGGSLPQTWVRDYLQAKRWSAVEAPVYEELVPGGNQRSKWASVDDPDFYQYHLTDIETFALRHLGEIQANEKDDDLRYDAVYSVAAFEHIHGLGSMLKLLANICNPGCVLYSYFTPIWSAPRGYHCDTRMNLPDYWHLCHSSMQAFDYFIDHGLDAAESEKEVYNIYKNPHINRLFPNEYLQIIHSSPWRIRAIDEINKKSVHDLGPVVAKNILRLSPMMTHVVDGYRLILDL